MIAFLDDYRGVFGVGPICRVLGIAPSTYHAFKAVERNPNLASDRARQDCLGHGRHQAKAGRNGRPPVFGDAAIQFCLIVKVLFGLPLRQTTEMVASILSMAGLDWPVSDFSTLCRRQKTIEVQITNRRVPGR